MEFIVRAHSAPADPTRFLAQVGRGGHVEYLAQIAVAALFIAKGHRADSKLTLVLEQSRDFSRAISLRGDRLGNLEGLTEAAILTRLAEALSAAGGLAKEASITLDNGIGVSATSFEHLVKERLGAGDVLLLDKKGADIRAAPLTQDAVFLLTDHVPMPKNLHKSLIRQGAKPISVGPVMLQAAHCVTVVLNELDRRGG